MTIQVVQISDTGPSQTPERPGTLGWRLWRRLGVLSFPAAVRCFGLLALTGASIGLLLWGIAHYAQLPAYALDNELAPRARNRLLLLLTTSASFGALTGGIFLLRARERAAERLERLTRQLVPLALLGLWPFLFHWRIWFERELDFCLFVSGYGLLAYAAFFTSLRARAGSEACSAWLMPPLARPVVHWLKRGITRTEHALPLVIVVLGALGYAAFFAYHTIAYHRSALTLAWDLAIENNILWNIVHGGSFLKASPITGLPGSTSHFGYHATLFSYVIAPFYLLWARPEGLLLFQAIVVGAAAIPLYLFARRQIGNYAACLIAVAYLLYPPVHGANLYDFHYPPLGVFWLWLTLYLIDAGHYKAASISALFTLSVREDIAFDLAILGGFIALGTARVRAGLVLVVVAMVYFFAVKLVAMPHFTEGNDYYLEQWRALVPEGGHGSTSVLMTVLGNPIFTFRSLLEQQKLLYFLQLGAPFAFFVWRRPIGLYLSLPGFFFTLLTVNAPPLIQISFQYTAHWTAFLFVAVVANLKAVSQPGAAGDGLHSVRRHAWLATIALMTLLTSYQFGALLQQNTVRGGFSQYKFGRTAADRERYQQLWSLLDQVPPQAKLAGSMFTLSQASNRPDAYYLRLGYFDAEYLLFELPPQRNEVRSLQEALQGEFGVIQREGPFVLARRGQGTEANEAILAEVH